jgi:hypothetical protein
MSSQEFRAFLTSTEAIESLNFVNLDKYWKMSLGDHFKKQSTKPCYQGLLIHTHLAAK